MALSILEADSPTGGSRFRFNIGKNRFYRFAVGKKARRNRHGIRVIDSPGLESPVLGPLPEQAMGRGAIELPTKRLGKEDRYLQLISFHSAKLDGPAISSIVTFQPEMTDSDLPVLALSQEKDMHSNSYPLPVHPFRIKDVQLSDALFIDALTNMLPTLLPALSGLVAGIAGGAKKTPAAGGGDLLQALLGIVSKPENLQQILKLVGSIKGAAAASPAAKVQAKAIANPSVPPGFSHAQVAPALLAALPALLPLLQQVLNPETIKSVLDAPTKHVGMLINGAKDFAKLGIESHEQDLKHLRELNPGVDDPGLDKLLASLSLGVAEMSKEIAYKRVTSVRLLFDGIVSSTLFGRTVIPYHSGQDIAFPLKAETPKPIGKSILDLVMKRADTLEIVHRSRIRFESVKSGALEQVPTIDRETLTGLEQNSDYIISATLVWKNKDGKKRGTSIQQQITLVGDYVFDRVEESSELIPLSDLGRFREYWHKTWQGRFSKDHKRYDMQLKYYYVLKKDSRENARLETLSKLEQEDRRKSGKLKSGMELSILALNRLLTTLKPGAQALTDAELSALMSEDFVERFNQNAFYHAKLRGRPGDLTAIWVYPEVKLQKVMLQRVDEANANGNVTAFTEHPVEFPIPAIIHFIGVRSS